MADVRKELEILVRVKNQTSSVWDELGRKGRWALDLIVGAGRRVVTTLTKVADWVNRNKFGLAALAGVSAFFASRFVSSIRQISASMSEAAASAQELNSRFSVVFADLEEEAASFGDALARGVGRGRQEVRAGLADFGQFFQSLQFSRETATDLAKTVTQLGVDLASFFDQQDAETFQLLRSGLVGNAEALDRFGARLTAAEVEQEVFRLGLARSSGEMTAQQQVVARLSLLMDRWKNAQGDAIRTADSFTNRMKGLRGALADLRVEFGTRLNEAILRGIETAGGLEKVEGLARVFYGSVEALAEVGIQVGAQLARQAAESIARIGGPQGVVQLIQQGAELAGAWLEAAAARAGAVVASIAAQAAPIIKALGGLLPDDPTERIQRIRVELERLDVAEAKAERELLLGAGGLSDDQLRAYQMGFQAVGEERAALIAELEALEAKYGDVVATNLAAQGKAAEADKRRVDAAQKLVETYDQLKAQGVAPEAPTTPQAVLNENTAKQTEVFAKAAKEAASSAVALETAFTRAQQAFRQGASNQIADTLFRMGEGAKSASEAFKDLGRSILYALLQQRLARGIEATFGAAFDSAFGFFNPASSFPTTPSAKGNVMQGGQAVTAFAKGGVLSSPVLFPMRGGVGLAGEAGPELIAPVKRMSNGDVGIQVEGAGGGGNTLALTIQAVDARSVVDLLANDARGFTDLVAAAVAKSPQLRGLLSGRV